jgi:chromosome segregation ATPase
MGSCRICSQELSKDSFVFVESSLDEKAAKRYETITKRTKIRELIKKGFSGTESRCFDCAQLLIEELNHQIREAEFERDSYLKYLQDTESETLDEERRKLQEEIKKLEDEDGVLAGTIIEATAQREDTQRTLEAYQKVKADLDQEEEIYWQRFAAYQRNLNILQEDHQSLISRREYGHKELIKLEQKNVYQDTFYINTSGRIGAINSFRLGRLADTPVFSHLHR